VPVVQRERFLRVLAYLRQHPRDAASRRILLACVRGIERELSD